MQQVRPGQGVSPSDKLMKIFQVMTSSLLLIMTHHDSQAGLKQIQIKGDENEEKTKLHTAHDEGLDLGMTHIRIMTHMTHNYHQVFDWSKSAAKKAIKTIQEVEWVRCLGLHPSGEIHQVNGLQV